MVRFSYPLPFFPSPAPLSCSFSLFLRISKIMGWECYLGMFVSESKFLSDPAAFIPHILNPNPSALEALITKPAVEAALLVRLEKKAKWYGQELGPTGEVVNVTTGAGETKLDVKEVVRLYKDYIIPLTKDVEVRLPPFRSSLSLSLALDNQRSSS